MRHVSLLIVETRSDSFDISPCDRAGRGVGSIKFGCVIQMGGDKGFKSLPGDT
jgi:hypothetical protein